MSPVTTAWTNCYQAMYVCENEKSNKNLTMAINGFVSVTVPQLFAQ